MIWPSSNWGRIRLPLLLLCTTVWSYTTSLSAQTNVAGESTINRSADMCWHHLSCLKRMMCKNGSISGKHKHSSKSHSILMTYSFICVIYPATESEIWEPFDASTRCSLGLQLLHCMAILKVHEVSKIQRLSLSPARVKLPWYSLMFGHLANFLVSRDFMFNHCNWCFPCILYIPSPNSPARSYHWPQSKSEYPGQSGLHWKLCCFLICFDMLRSILPDLALIGVSCWIQGVNWSQLSNFEQKATVRNLENFILDFTIFYHRVQNKSKKDVPSDFASGSCSAANAGSVLHWNCMWQLPPRPKMARLRNQKWWLFIMWKN